MRFESLQLLLVTWNGCLFICLDTTCCAAVYLTSLFFQLEASTPESSPRASLLLPAPHEYLRAHGYTPTPAVTQSRQMSPPQLFPLVMSSPSQSVRSKFSPSSNEIVLEGATARTNDVM
jgi:hypothetical protein